VLLFKGLLGTPLPNETVSCSQANAETLCGDDVGPAAVGGEGSGGDLFVHVQN